jgi:transposase
MPRAIEVTRRDHSSKDLRKQSAQMRTSEAARRVLAIANVLDGMSREMAARLAGLDRQSLRDWVHRYNAEGVEGLYDRKAPGKKAQLDEGQRKQLREIVLKGPDPAADGIVRWRCCDLQELIRREYGVSYHARYIGRLLGKLGLSYITGRPRHPKGDPQQQEEFKKTSKPSSRRPFPNTPKARPSKSGSRTKRASARKAG